MKDYYRDELRKIERDFKKQWETNLPTLQREWEELNITQAIDIVWPMIRVVDGHILQVTLSRDAMTDEQRDAYDRFFKFFFEISPRLLW